MHPNIWKLRQHYREHTLRRKVAKETPKISDPTPKSSIPISASAQMPPPPPPPPPPPAPSQTSRSSSLSCLSSDKINLNKDSPVDSPRPKRKLNAVRDDHSYDFRRAKTIPKIPDDRSDHQYSTRSLRKLPVKFHQSKTTKFSKRVEENSTKVVAQVDSQEVSKPLSSQVISEPRAVTRKSSSPSAEIRKSRQRPSLKAQSIQAMGHSYAAARPRRISGSLTGGKGPLTTQMYPCDQCNKTFPQPYRLNRHIKEVHIKEKRHFCQFCDKAFFKTTSKDRHELTHSDHQLWRCDVCEKTFRDQSSLKYHMNHNVCGKKESDIEGA